MDAIETTTIEREILVAASRETIWDFLVDPNLIVQWMGIAAEVDLRRGADYRIEVIPGHIVMGQFVEIDAPRRLVYTWGWEGSGSVPPGTTTVSFELVPHGDGTLLRFRHTDLPTVASASSHTHGWSHYLSRLSTLLAGNDPVPDPWINGPQS